MLKPLLLFFLPSSFFLPDRLRGALRVVKVSKGLLLSSFSSKSPLLVLASAAWSFGLPPSVCFTSLRSVYKRNLFLPEVAHLHIPADRNKINFIYIPGMSKSSRKLRRIKQKRYTLPALLSSQQLLFLVKIALRN